MKSLLFIIALTLSVLKVSATAQTPDLIIYEGEEYAMQTNPLEIFFKKNPEKRPQRTVISTANWRGYVAMFEIVDNNLYLKNIEVWYYDDDSKEPSKKNALNEVFPNQEKVKVDWMNGLLVLPYGELENYVHLGYGSTFSNYILLEIENGVLKREKKLNSKEYKKIKEKQFQAFKKTEEYRKLKEELHGHGSDEFFDSFVRNQIVSYTSKILVE